METFRLKQFVVVRETPLYFVLSNKNGGVYGFNRSPEIDILVRKLLHEGLTVAELELLDPNLKYYLQEEQLLEAPTAAGTRNQLFFDYLAYRDPSFSNDLDTLPHKKVLILGAGGGGSAIAYQLAQLGISHITVVDDDTVAESDLTKTLVYRAADIGREKVAALKDTIKSNLGADITALPLRLDPDNIAGILEKYSDVDLVINAIDPDPLHKMIVNRQAFLHGIPVFFLAYSYDQLILGPLLEPGHTACYEAYNKILRNSVNGAFDFYSLQKAGSSYLLFPSVSFITNLLASLAVKEIVYFLTGNRSYCGTYGKVLLLSSATMKTETVTLECASCNVCKEAPAPVLP